MQPGPASIPHDPGAAPHGDLHEIQSLEPRRKRNYVIVDLESAILDKTGHRRYLAMECHVPSDDDTKSRRHYARGEDPLLTPRWVFQSVVTAVIMVLTEHDDGNVDIARMVKPGALRNGAPFKDWPLSPAIERVRRRLGGHANSGRQMVGILSAVTSDGLDAVQAACAEAIAGGTISRDVVLNILTRQRAPMPPLTIATPEALRLVHEPVADCTRYDSLRSFYGTPRDTGDDGNAEACRHAARL